MFISPRYRSDLLQSNLVHSLSLPRSHPILLRLLAIVRMSNDLDTTSLFPLGVIVVDVCRWHRIDHRPKIYVQTRSDSLVGVCILCLWISSADCYPVHDTVSHGRFHEHLVRIGTAEMFVEDVSRKSNRPFPVLFQLLALSWLWLPLGICYSFCASDLRESFLMKILILDGSPVVHFRPMLVSFFFRSALVVRMFRMIRKWRRPGLSSVWRLSMERNESSLFDRSSLRHLSLFSVFFGLIWFTGLFFFHEHNGLVFSYVLTILNSYQGIFIWLFYCLGQKPIQNFYLHRCFYSFKSTKQVNPKRT